MLLMVPAADDNVNHTGKGGVTVPDGLNHILLESDLLIDRSKGICRYFALRDFKRIRFMVCLFQ